MGMEKQKKHPLEQEMRRYRRFRTRIPFKFYIIKYENVNLTPIKGKAGEGIVTNLSLGGFEFAADLHLPVGMELRVDLVLSEDDRLQCRGRVSRFDRTSQRYSYGFVFAELSAANREKISTYIAGRLALEGKITSYLKNLRGSPLVRA